MYQIYDSTIMNTGTIKNDLLYSRIDAIEETNDT